jgi:hypothetical protein
MVGRDLEHGVLAVLASRRPGSEKNARRRPRPTNGSGGGRPHQDTTRAARDAHTVNTRSGRHSSIFYLRNTSGLLRAAETCSVTARRALTTNAGNLKRDAVFVRIHPRAARGGGDALGDVCLRAGVHNRHRRLAIQVRREVKAARAWHASPQVVRAWQHAPPPTLTKPPAGGLAPSLLLPLQKGAAHAVDERHAGGLLLQRGAHLVLGVAARVVAGGGALLDRGAFTAHGDGGSCGSTMPRARTGTAGDARNERQAGRRQARAHCTRSSSSGPLSSSPHTQVLCCLGCCGTWFYVWSLAMRLRPGDPLSKLVMGASAAGTAAAGGGGSA